jgi:hypothetical protein
MAVLPGRFYTEAANAVAKYMVPGSTKKVHRLARDENGRCIVGMVFTSALILTFAPGEKESPQSGSGFADDCRQSSRVNFQGDGE